MNKDMVKKIIFISVPIAIILITVIVILILYFGTDTFKSNEDLFWKYFAQNESIINIINNDKVLEQENFKQNNNYEGNGNLTYIEEQGEENYKQFNVDTVSKHDAINDKSSMEVNLKNGELDLFNLILARSGDFIGFKCEEVFDKYVGIQNNNLTELAQNYGLQNAENLPDSFDIQEYKDVLNLTDEQKKHLIDFYLPVIKKYINKEKYEKNTETITIDFSEHSWNIYMYDVTTYKVNISSEEQQSIIIDCANTLKTDTETLILISNKLSLLGLGTEYTDTANLQKQIENYIIKLTEKPIKSGLEITIYETEDKVVRTSISSEDYFTLVYDKVDNMERLTIEIEGIDNIDLSRIIENEKNNINSSSDTNAVSDENNISNSNNANDVQSDSKTDIIDLNESSAINQNENITTRIEIVKSNSEAISTNKIKIIPDISKPVSAELVINMSNVQNDNISNTYTIVINLDENSKNKVITINYENNINKIEQVEIEDLTSTNTAIANNYEPEVFKNFMNQYMVIFMDKLEEKMAMLGLVELK